MIVQSADIYRVPIRAGFCPILVRLLTDDGIEGVGEVGLAYGKGGLAGAGMLQELVKEYILGSDPRLIEQLWHKGYQTTFWGQGGGPVVYGAMSALDMALWDIKGKAAGLPVHEMLGGPVESNLHVYANGWYTSRDAQGAMHPCITPQEYADAALRTVEAGFDAMKFDPFAVSPDGVWNVPDRLLSHERANLAYDRVAAVRDAVGPDVDICVEVHGNLSVSAAIEMGRRLAELNPFFYEEPVDAMNVDAMLKVSQNVPMPIAAGERLYTRRGFRQYIEKQALDILQPDIGLAGGITELKKIASYAETYDIFVQPHRYASPVTTAASLQLDASITNFVIQEFFPFETDGVCNLVEDALERKAVNSHVAVPTEPGLGVALNHDLVGAYRIAHLER